MASSDNPFEYDPVGVSGGIAPAPVQDVWGALGVAPAHIQRQQGLAQMNAAAQALNNWPSKAAQQWIAAQKSSAVQGMLGGAASWQTVATPLVEAIPIEEAGREKIRQLTVQLPMRALEKIANISLHKDPLRFAITYKNSHVLEIHEVDSFPAAEHISRILLALP